MTEKWSDRQNRIYDGLSSIGREIAGFYEAGLRIYSGDCPNGSYFLIHSAREISAGLRTIFGVDNPLKRGEPEHHKQSILVSLGFSDFEGLAKDWYEISTNLERYAHGHGAWKTPRPLAEARPLWDQFEDILERLVGSYYAIIQRIEHMGEIKNLEGGVVETLCNILSIPIYYNYFFLKEKDLKWFYVLKERNYFSPEQINFDEQGNVNFWNVLAYLERVSEKATQSPQYGKELLAIIEDVVQFSQNKKRINNYQIWWYCVKILNNLPNGIIKEHLSVKEFRSWLSVWTDSSLGPITDIGEKLLRKFLGDDSNLAYAEAVIDAITEIRAGGKPNSSFNLEEAIFVWDFYWVRDAFQKNYKLIGQKCSLNIILRIADKLCKALEYKQKNPYLDIEIGKDIYQIKASRIPTEGVKSDEINFKAGQYECSVKQYSQDQLKYLEKHKYFPAYINIDPQIELKRFAFSAFNREAMVAAVKRSLPVEINWERDGKLEKRLGYIFDGLFSDYSYVQIKSLATGAREHENGVEEILTIILRDILLAKCEANRDDGRQILDAFLSDKYQFPVFKRFVLLCIDKFWADHAGLMDRFLELYPDALAKSDFKVEMYDILHNHNSDFSAALKTKLKEFINVVPEYYMEEGEKHVAYWKYKWLSPLRDNPDFSALYEDAIKKAEIKDNKPYEPERSSDFKVVNVVHKSPLSKEDILQKPIIETVKVLKEFKGADYRLGIFEGKPDKEGLANAFQAAVKENPKKFTDEMSAFLQTDDFYTRYLLRGLKEAWGDNKEIDWGNIFDFSAGYLTQAADSITKKVAPLEQDEDKEKDKPLRVVGDIVELISDGCRDDKHAFDPKHFEKVEQLFDSILPLIKEEKYPDKKTDALAYAWNTLLGRTIMAYVSFSLRVARATKKRPEDWGQQKYERFFKKGLQTFPLFGSYLPQMKYLDEAYAKEKIEFFAQKDHGDFEWKMFMEGYLVEARVYKDVYGLMRENYLKGLENNVFEKQIDQRLVDHICIGYLFFDELLTDTNNDGKVSLFWKMLTNAGALGKRERWMEVIHYFWANTGRTTRKDDKTEEENLKIKDKILKFWAWTYNQPDFAKSNLGEDYNAFLGRLTELTILFDKIDEDKGKWLLLSAPHIDQHQAHFFIQSLTKFDDQESIKRIGKIFLKVLEKAPPMIKEEDIALIVRRIYEKGGRNDADKICEAYGRRSLHFLRPLWEEFQKKDLR